MNKLWWLPIVQWALWGLAMTAVMGWISRNRDRARGAAQARRLLHPRSTLVIGLGGSLLFFALAVISNVYANKTTTFWTTAVFVGFAIMSLAAIAEYFFARHEVTDDGLHYGRISGRRGSLQWSDVARVRYSAGMKWFRIETAAGQIARISVMLSGLPEFARVVLAQVPRTAIDEDTRAILNATASGKPPAVWGP
jgi:hypothetical protein